MKVDLIQRGAQRRRSIFLRVVLFVMMVFIVAAFLFFSFEPTLLPQWLLQLQAAARAGLDTVVTLAPVEMPFAIVGGLGAIIGLAEATATFTNYPRSVLLSRWVWILVLMNTAISMVVFGVVWAYTLDTDPLLLAFSVGLGFQTLIRTKFTLAKQFGGSGEDREISVNFGWIYDQFQNFCKTRIDLELMSRHVQAVADLSGLYQDAADLYWLGVYTIDSRTTLTKEEKDLRKQDLLKTFQESGKAPLFYVRARLALFIAEAGGDDSTSVLPPQVVGTAALAEGSAAPATLLPQLPRLPTWRNQPAPPAFNRTSLDRLLQRYTTVQELCDVATYMLDIQNNSTPEEQQSRRTALNRLCNTRGPADLVRGQIAHFILTTGENNFLEVLLAQAESIQPGGTLIVSLAAPEASNPTVAREAAVVKQLIAKFASLKELIDFAVDRSTDPARKEWLNGFLTPTSEATEEERKMTIAFALIRDLGLERVRELAGLS